jgi:hypothetical protein
MAETCQGYIKGLEKANLQKDRQKTKRPGSWLAHFSSVPYSAQVSRECPNFIFHLRPSVVICG